MSARRRRQFTSEEKLTIVLAGLKGDQPVTELCRRHGISQTLFSRWKDQFLAGGLERLGRNTSASAEVQALKARVSELERALGRQTYELEVLRKALGR